MNLFQAGDFDLHSGGTSNWKIECDALKDDDWQTLAKLIAERVPAFGSVYGIPHGGVPLAQFLGPYATEGPLLIVDDVLTTGESMQHAHEIQPDAIGSVVFARGPCPAWVTPLFQMVA